MALLWLFIFVDLLISSGAVGPLVNATKGEVWPKPQQQEKSDDYYVVPPSSFRFKSPEKVSCPNLLGQALDRYQKMITRKDLQSLEKRSLQDEHYLGNLEFFEVKVDECQDYLYPSLTDNENYNITVSSSGGVLAAASIWGIFRGLETLSQLVYETDDQLRINVTTIIDYPRFPHRGLLIDTSRHFQPVSVILKMLDAMAYNKLNVFHWHLTDDHSFPYSSINFPELSDKGAYHPYLAVYQQMDIADIIEYARFRGIRVIPEIDTPAHTSSWGAAHPELLTQCFDGNGPTGELGPLDPTKDSTINFIKDLFLELQGVFPDWYVHIGGDEVDFSCWESNPAIRAFMVRSNISTFEELLNHYFGNVEGILAHLRGRRVLFWEEAFTNGFKSDGIVQVWKNNGFSKLMKVVEAGHQAVFSSCWYLSNLHSGGDWIDFYKCEPLVLIDEEEQRKLVLGGEACMWGEYVNEFNIIPRVWPRASAVAERLWSSEDVKSIEDAAARLEEHACRMNKRGIAAQPPNGPGFCL